MQKTVSGLVAVICLTCCNLANASPGARVAMVSSSAWIQQGEGKTDLAAGSEINSGDQVVTGENGRIEIELWSDVRLRVYPASQVIVMNPAEFDESVSPPLLKLQSGRICLESPPASGSGNHFKLNLDDLLLATIQQYGHICASRREDLSAINLRAGSVQINNEVDPAIVILSEAGTVFNMDDEGAYQLLSLVDESEVADMRQEPFITALETVQPVPDTNADAEQETVETETASQALTTDEQAEASQPEAAPAAGTSGFVYTVYLFSTRSDEVAERVNKKFQQAGHQTRILIRENENPVRYRIAVPGFESRQSASEFADSIVGKLGIRDTWIGKDRPAIEE